jgi:hypothetical protein
VSQTPGLHILLAKHSRHSIFQKDSRGILCGTGLGWVNTELVAGAVGTENGSKVNSTETLGLEELVQVIGWRMDVRKTASDTASCSVLAADQNGDLGTTWAGDNGVGYWCKSEYVQPNQNRSVTYCP